VEAMSRLGPRKYVTNLWKAMWGRPMVTLSDGELISLSVLSKSLMEEAASPDWRQQEEYQRKEAIAVKAYKQYGLNPWVYACVYANSTNYASVPIEFKQVKTVIGEDGTEETTETVITDPRVRKLLKRPNRYETMYDLRESTMAYLDLIGTAYWEKGRDEDGNVVALWSIRPDLLEAHGDKDNLVTHYTFNGSKVGIPV
jgi:phage portal protein BeeE